MISTRAELTAAMASGFEPQFVFFWGHHAKAPGVADRSCFSQWFESPFVVDGVTYATAEHWMMVQKARRFQDTEAARAILEATTPAEAKALGRGVRGFDDAAWAGKRFELVIAGNVAKFSAHPALKAVLLETQSAVLVEAAPRDQIWGIGLSASNPRAVTPEHWRGQNLLGFALMQVRDHLSR